MMFNQHTFEIDVTWENNSEVSTEVNPKKFSRDHTVDAKGLQSIQASSARVFHGSAKKWNPELLFTASVAQCNMLTFLFLASRQDISIKRYADSARCTLILDKNGVGGEISAVDLFPTVTIATKQSEQTDAILDQICEDVSQQCFIRRSVKCSVSENYNFVFTH